MEMGQFDFSSSEELFKSLIDRALTQKNSNFEFIRNTDMLRAARLYKSGIKKVSKMFNNLVKELIAKHANQVRHGTATVETLLAILQFENCRDFYKKEIAIAKDMLSEYRTYVFSGHIFDQFVCGFTRPDNECVDYRKLPIKFF